MLLKYIKKEKYMKNKFIKKKNEIIFSPFAEQCVL